MNAQAARESAIYERWAQDLGGREALTAGQECVLIRCVQADLVAETAAAYLRRSREAVTNPRIVKVVDVLLASTDRVYRGAALLGLHRRETRVQSLREVLDAMPGTDAEPAE